MKLNCDRMNKSRCIFSGLKKNQQWLPAVGFEPFWAVLGEMAIVWYGTVHCLTAIFYFILVPSQNGRPQPWESWQDWKKG